MKLPSTITTVTGRAHHASLRRCAAAIGGRGPLITRAIDPPLRRFGTGELLLPVRVQVTAVTVVEHDGRETVDLQPPDRLGAEVFVGDDLGFLDELREHRAGTADAAEVRGPVLLERVLHRLPTIALADGALQARLEQGG